jgi:hypothetical protein
MQRSAWHPGFDDLPVGLVGEALGMGIPEMTEILTKDAPGAEERLHPMFCREPVLATPGRVSFVAAGGIRKKGRLVALRRVWVWRAGSVVQLFRRRAAAALRGSCARRERVTVRGLAKASLLGDAVNAFLVPLSGLDRVAQLLPSTPLMKPRTLSACQPVSATGYCAKGQS